jgi:hypothetical protein
MTLDPIVSLSVALAEAPGSCACLLGAGVSEDAGVPTAWGIYREGLQRLDRVQTGSEESLPDEQLDEWLAEHGYEDLGYSTLVDTIAPDPPSDGRCSPATSTASSPEKRMNASRSWRQPASCVCSS